MANYFNDDEAQIEYLRQYTYKRTYKRNCRRLALEYLRLAVKCFIMSMKG